jgi:hypothetical protein
VTELSGDIIIQAFGEKSVDWSVLRSDGSEHADKVKPMVNPAVALALHFRNSLRVMLVRSMVLI